MTEIPRPEYPRPQFQRERWLCLNGPWQFEMDPGDSGLERGLRERALNSEIIVPFCPESKLSGIEHVDFMHAVWYRREVTIPLDWKDSRVLLHFGAVDYDATVWANGVEVGRHRGGFSPLTCDLTNVAQAGETVAIVVRARDEHQPPQPMGKQSPLYHNHGCLYTRTTGIWQTVWMEPVPRVALERPRITPDLEHGQFRVQVMARPYRAGYVVRATVHEGEEELARAEAATGAYLTPEMTLTIPPDRVRAWSTEDPHLYSIDLELFDENGALVDRAESYGGLRSVTIDGAAIRINGRPVFQRLVLDQGYYADGIMTAPSDAALIEDIELSIRAGFNGARLHQKVFEERFLYHADRLGYLVWGEFGDWGCRIDPNSPDPEQQPGPEFITQWLEVLERDYSHPSIVGWCPLNETVQGIRDQITLLDDVTRGMFLATRAMDLSRPILDASGYSHRVPETDVYDSHDYDQDPKSFRERHDQLLEDQPYLNGSPENPISIPYGGQPYFVSEFGGIWWNPKAARHEDSWGYGERPKNLEEFYQRFEGLCDALLDNPRMFGYCYTQLTDVFQEQNGIFGFDRSTKFDLERLAKIQCRTAAIEQQ